MAYLLLLEALPDTMKAMLELHVLHMYSIPVMVTPGVAGVHGA